MLQSIYQEIILDHYRHPHHKGLREPYDAEVHHINPTCGDEVTLRVRLSRAEDGPAGDTANDADGVDDVADDAAESAANSPADGDVRVSRRVVRRARLFNQPGECFCHDGSRDRENCRRGARGGRRVPRAHAGAGDVAPDEDTLEDAVAFAGVAKYPARVKCALLGWMAWKDATIRALNGKAGRAS